MAIIPSKSFFDYSKKKSPDKISRIFSLAVEKFRGS